MSHEIIENDNAIAHLPIELFVEILSYLPEEQLKVFKQVCKYWQDNIDFYFSLSGKFLSMQRWHNLQIDKTIMALEKFKNTYTIINYRNVYIRGRLETTAPLYLATFSIGLFVPILLMSTLSYLLRRHRERPLWEQTQYANKMHDVKIGLISVTIMSILTAIAVLFIPTRRERNEHSLLLVTPAIIEKLKAIYMKSRFFLDELSNPALRQLLFHPQTAAIALPSNQQLNQMISDECAKLPQLKEEVASYTNTLVKQTAVNRDRVSNYCLRALSLWNQTHPRRYISISEGTGANITSTVTCTTSINRRVP